MESETQPFLFYLLFISDPLKFLLRKRQKNRAFYNFVLLKPKRHTMQNLISPKYRKPSASSNKAHDLTTGNITKTMLWFAAPMILGNLLQQFYNIADTLIVGQFLGAEALAAVGSAYTLIIFLTSVFLGLCMGSGVIFSLRYGANDLPGLKRSIFDRRA